MFIFRVAYLSVMMIIIGWVVKGSGVGAFDSVSIVFRVFAVCISFIVKLSGSFEGAVRVIGFV